MTFRPRQRFLVDLLPALGVLGLLLALASVSAAAGSPPAAKGVLAFERERDIWVSGLDGSAPRKLVRGSDPALSPDGRSLAYTRDESTASKVRRRIAILDLATGKSRILASVPGDNAFGASWSPDGTTLLFSSWVDRDWALASIGVDDTGFRVIHRDNDPIGDCWMPVFAADGESWFCHDLESIRRFGLDGKELWKSDLASHLPNGGFNSGCRISASADGASLLVEVDMDEAGERPGWDGPPPALFRVDLSTGEWNRASPAGLFAWEGSWLPGGDILCTCLPAGKKDPQLCRIPAAGGEAVKLLPRARSGTAAVSR